MALWKNNKVMVIRNVVAVVTEWKQGKVTERKQAKVTERKQGKVTEWK